MFGRLLGKKEDPEVRGYVECMLLLALADGELEEDELDSIFTTFASHPKMENMGWKELKAIAIRSLGAMERQGEEARIRAVASLLPTVEQRMEALELSLSVAMADGELEPPEAKILEKIQRVFGLSEQQVEEIISRYTGN